MNLLDDIKNIYFVGIGGIGMSAIARYFHETGFNVAGYDKTPSPLTDVMMAKEGIPIIFTDDLNEVDDKFKNAEDTLIIYTPAVPHDNEILSFFRDNGFLFKKRAEVLGILSQNKKALCIAGTHGKTTTTTLLAFLMKNSKVGCSAFLGGISSNFNSNLLIDTVSDYVVIEADEYDRSFLHLHPDIAIITSMDPDHLDIYGTHEELIKAFNQYAVQSRLVFVKKGLELSSREASGCYAVESRCDFYADKLRIENGGYMFDYVSEDFKIRNLRLNFPGRVNVENATAAITVALHAGVEPDEIKSALPEFRGVARRFDIHVRKTNTIYIDDYAHHPKEIEAALSSIRELWPDKRLTVAFQPHLYSRTNDFYMEFAHSLDLADRVVLLDIYPARELPMEGVTSGLIAENLKVPVKCVNKEEFLDYVENNVKDGIFVSLGAGDIDRFIPNLTEIFMKK